MAKTISKTQKICMFSGAAVLGALCVGSLTFAILTEDSARDTTTRDFALWAACSVALLCYLVFVMVFGAWLGGVVSVLWRSPPGKRLFWTLSGGTLGGIVTVAGATDWMVREESAAARASMMTAILVFGAVILVGTLLGLLIGLVIGRWRQSAAELVEVS